MTALPSFENSFSFRKSSHILSQLCRTLLPSDHQIIRWLEEENWLALATARVDYSSHQNSSTVRSERQCLAFFQKNASLPLGLNRREIAKQKFDQAERACKVTNWRFRNPENPGTNLDTNFLAKVAWKISQILGPVPSFAELDFGFGPGSNIGTLRRQTSARAKMSVVPTCTANAQPLVERLLAECPHWDYLSNTKVVDHGKLSFVPKDAKTDRAIETQPSVNAFLQIGVGKWIKRRLLEFGCDLRRGQSKNADMAQVGSETGHYATIDLSSASDTIASMLVLDLLPAEWFDLLDCLRTPSVKYQGELIHLEKFSAMGNGSTFELETLIFYAICLVESGPDVHCYGDDIIVPSSDASRVIARLEMCGFSVNTDKTYITGPFRESCGKDFFNGVDVRPAYVKDLLSYKDLFRLHNFFFRRGMQELADLCLKFIPKRMQSITGPDGFGDGHLLSLTPDLVPHGREKGWAGWTFRSYKRKPRRVKTPLRGDYAAILYLTRNGQDAWWRPRPSVRDVMYHERGGAEYVLKRLYTL